MSLSLSTFLIHREVSWPSFNKLFVKHKVLEVMKICIVMRQLGYFLFFETSLVVWRNNCWKGAFADVVLVLLSSKDWVRVGKRFYVGDFGILFLYLRCSQSFTEFDVILNYTLNIFIISLTKELRPHRKSILALVSNYSILYQPPQKSNQFRSYSYSFHLFARDAIPLDVIGNFNIKS